MHRTRVRDRILVSCPGACRNAAYCPGGAEPQPETPNGAGGDSSHGFGRAGGCRRASPGQLHREEQLTELQRTSLLQEHKRHKACEADVQEFLQQLKKRLPGIARDLAISFADPLTLYGGG